MVTLEQVRLLEAKVTKAIDFVRRVAGENTRLKDENSQLAEKLDSCQRRIDELEVLIQDFKEEQSRIEEGILSALERLNQFEDTVEKTIGEPGDRGDDGNAGGAFGAGSDGVSPEEAAGLISPGGNESGDTMTSPAGDENKSDDPGHGELEIF